jgi:hypothetical protein
MVGLALLPEPWPTSTGPRGGVATDAETPLRHCPRFRETYSWREGNDS